MPTILPGRVATPVPKPSTEFSTATNAVSPTNNSPASNFLLIKDLLVGQGAEVVRSPTTPLTTSSPHHSLLLRALCFRNEGQRLLQDLLTIRGRWIAPAVLPVLIDLEWNVQLLGNFFLR